VPTFTAADLEYLHASFTTLPALCAGRMETPERVSALVEEGLLPRPSYVLDDGTGLFPADYFRLVDEAGSPARVPAHFARRYVAACRSERRDPGDLDADWDAYLSGIYGVCLREVTPETIVRKAALVSSLCELLVLARPDDPAWRDRLRAQVDELSLLEREFAPDFDRDPARFGRPPTRDLLIGTAHDRFPDVFAARRAA